MKRLYLVRHAKSSWEHEGISDFDRPLKGRGIRDAHTSSQWLLKQGEQPQLMVSSPATRAVHTALIFAKNLNYAYANIVLEEGIYSGDEQDLLDLVRTFDDRFDSVYLFGHNPTLTALVNLCIEHIIDKVPTTGVACLQFKTEHWSELPLNSELVFFDYPKKRSSKWFFLIVPV